MACVQRRDLHSIGSRFAYHAQQQDNTHHHVSSQPPHLPPKPPSQPVLPPKIPISHKGPELPPKIKLEDKEIHRTGPTTDGKWRSCCGNVMIIQAMYESSVNGTRRATEKDAVTRGNTRKIPVYCSAKHKQEDRDMWHTGRHIGKWVSTNVHGQWITKSNTVEK